ncbi:MAG: FAD-dependent oxidoreductase [Xanthobacteraceae bacterium]
MKLPSRRRARIAVLGAGIMGCSLAMFLARRGADVTLIDEADAPFARTSRWNEGKIHLGYLYAGDPSLATARKMLTGGLAFRPLVEELIGAPISDAATSQDDVFLVHHTSIVAPDAMNRYFAAVSELIRSHPDVASYPVDVSQARSYALTARELSEISGSPLIVSGFRVPERSIQTQWLADRFAGAVLAEPHIAFLANTRVLEVDKGENGWTVKSTGSIEERFDIIINALWEGRIAIDSAVGIAADVDVSYRYRLALFVRTDQPIALPNAVIATGPFGDVKNYNGTDFYLSWYPAGLIADAAGPTPPALPPRDGATDSNVAAETFAALAALLPGVQNVRSHVAEMAVEGGWVVAPGTGALSDPACKLHQRDRFGVRRYGSFITVDTGKYSTAPWLAKQIVDELLGEPASRHGR